MAQQPKNGFCCGYQVRETSDKGLGVFATEPIPKGHLVWRFVPGHFKVFDEQAFGTALARMTQDDAVYELTHTFGLRDFPTCVIRVLDEGVLINHSKNANLATNFDTPLRAEFDASSQIFLQEIGLALPEDRYALIATRDIEPGEEFTNNYFEDEFDPPFYLRLYEEYGVEENYLE